MNKIPGLKNKEILICLLLGVICYSISRMFSDCGIKSGCYNGFSVGAGAISMSMERWKWDSNDTTDILIESAYFNPVTIRKGSKLLDLSTDASKRFERDTDIDNVIYSLDALAALVQEIAGGKICKDLIDVYPKAKSSIQIDFNIDDFINFASKRFPKRSPKEDSKVLPVSLKDQTHSPHTLFAKI